MESAGIAAEVQGGELHVPLRKVDGSAGAGRAGLERKGWIRRGRDEDNQRYIRLYLTPEGRLIAAQVWRAWQSRQARLIGSLSDEERAGLSAGLRGLVRGLASEGLLGDTPASQGES